jgi:hypothetical protein
VLLRRSVVTITIGAALMVGPAWLVATKTTDSLGAPLGPRVGVLAAALTGLAVFIGVQAALRAPEVASLGSGARQLIGHRHSRSAEAADV